jgi:hypothetical protein
MGNDELHAYLRENLNKGFTAEALTQALVQGGWNADDVAHAIRTVTTSPSITQPVAPPQVAVVENPVLAQEEVGPQVATPISPTVDALVSPAAINSGAETVAVNESPVQPQEFSDNSSRRKKIVFVVAIIVFLFAFGSATAGYFFFVNKAPKPEVVLLHTHMHLIPKWYLILP